MCVCVCVCVCVFVCEGESVCVCVSATAYIYVYVYMYIYIHTHIPVISILGLRLLKLTYARGSLSCPNCMRMDACALSIKRTSRITAATCRGDVISLSYFLVI